MITLYVDGFYVSPLDASCLIALDEKRAEYQTVRALLRDGQGVPQALGQRTVISRVPALQHNDFFLTESLAIIDYVDQIFPSPPLFPVEPQARARARQVMAYLRFEFHALREERPWWTVVYPGTELAPLSAKAQREASELIEITSRFLPELGGFSIAHADLALQLMRLSHNGFAMPEALSRFVEVTCARSSVRAYLDHARPPNPPPRPSGLG